MSNQIKTLLLACILAAVCVGCVASERDAINNVRVEFPGAIVEALPVSGYRWFAVKTTNGDVWFVACENGTDDQISRKRELFTNRKD